MEKKQLTIYGFNWFEVNFGNFFMDADDFGQLITDCLLCFNMENVDDVYDNMSVFDGSGAEKFNMFPNVKEAVNIIENSAKDFPYIIFGNWIITHNVPDSIWCVLDDMNLVPYYGYGHKITDYKH